jgi:hypothetical protein
MELYALHALIELHGPEGRKNEVNGMHYMDRNDVADSTPYTNEKDEMPITPYTNGKTV